MKASPSILSWLSPRQSLRQRAPNRMARLRWFLPLLVIIFVILAIAGVALPHPAPTTDPLPPRRAERPSQRTAPTKASSVVPADWWGQVQQDLTAREYHASINDRGLQAPNRAHNWRIYFQSNGIEVKERTATEPELLQLGLAEWGRAGQMLPAEPGELVNLDERVEIRRAGLTEWYLNSERGLEHGFELAARPAGTGNLQLNLAVTGVEVSQSGDTIVFHSDAGPTLHYNQLHVFDAAGSTLPAHLEIAAVDPARVQIIIDDADAVYPLTVDPILAADKAAIILERNQANAGLGYSVARAGDVNGDGYDDIVVGAPGYDYDETDEGVAFVYHGGPAGISATPAITLEIDGGGTFVSYGRSVAGAGDVNGDGYDDVFIGAPWYDNLESNEGAVFIYHGSADGINPTPAAMGEGNHSSYNLGESIAGAGDINNDGYDDVLIGVRMYQNQSQEGAAFIYYGSAGGIDFNTPVVLEGNQLSLLFGSSVAGAGDVNGDGYDDILVGAIWYTNGETKEGAAYVYHGGASGISATPAITIEGSAVIDDLYGIDGDAVNLNLGESVAGVGDINADGYDDIVIGTSYLDNPYADLWGGGEDGTATEAGGFFVYYGGPGGVNPELAGSVVGDEDYDWLGDRPAAGGDINGDGYDDLVLGAEWECGITYCGGRVRVYHGGPDGPNTESANLIIEAENSSSYFGESVAVADINGDGYADVIAGDDEYTNGQNDEGAVFIYHGSAYGVSSCTAAVTVQNTNDSGAGTLRQALVDVCPGGTIDFAAELAGQTITLTSTELSIAKTVTLTNPHAAGLTLSGNNAHPVFNIGSNGVATLNRLAIISGTGSTGGGIYNAGTLTLQNSAVTGNSATTYGGGIASFGTLTVQNSAVAGNTAGTNGGGIFSFGLLTAQNSTMAGNSATTGGGLSNYGTLYISNTIIADSPSGGDCHNVGTVAANSHNLLEATGADACGLSNGAGGSLIGVDPLFGDWGDYGGGSPTLPLLPGSPAIDAGAGCLPADQRGVGRPQPGGGSCDLGAFESQGFILTLGGGSGQTEGTARAFSVPLTLTVASSYAEPVNGGQVTFTGPGSGAGLNPTLYQAVITNGVAGQVVTANKIIGSYGVTATTAGNLGSPVSFALTNTLIYAELSTFNPAANTVAVPLSSPVVLTYNTTMSSATITSRTIAIYSMMQGFVTATHTISGNVATVTPNHPFFPGELVYAIATSQTTDLEGVHPPNAWQWQFTAGEVFDRRIGFFTRIATGLSGGWLGSAAAWGDYDHDGDLDILLAGQDSSQNPVTRIYRNDAGSFTDLNAGLPGVYHSSAAWGDYDNDGDLDILLIGTDGSDGSNPITHIYRNDAGSFVNINAGLAGNGYGSVAWGDYDNDGDLDILIAGWQGSRIYRNDNGSFSNINAGLPSASNGSAVWGDYDNDGDLDILLTGSFIAKIYRNVSGSFTDINAGLTGVVGTAAWGDYDNDGDLDILLNGYNGGGPITRIYRNDSGSFTDLNAGLSGRQYGNVAWGDYDNDGDLDILLTGQDNNYDAITWIYRNDNGSFVNINAGLSGVSYGKVAWGDYDNDGDLDILMTSGGGVIYRNDDYPLPSLTTFSPAANATVSLDSDVQLSYNMDIDAAGVTSRTVAVHSMQQGLVTATHTVNGNTITVTPSRPFFPGELVYAIATTQTTDIFATHPLTATQWQFTAAHITNRCVAGFTDIDAGLPGVRYSDTAWGDYDRDGDLDILLTGHDGSSHITKIYRNNGDSFSDIGAELTGLAYSRAAWGDYDNDGDLDLLLIGNDDSYAPHTQLYRNDNGSFTDINAGLPGVYSGSAAWGDYDNDGDLDILLTGLDSGSFISKIYRNDNGSFTDISAGLTGVVHGGTAWGDYDNDGDLDILLTGDDGLNLISKIYRNDNGSFTDISAGLTGVGFSSAAWGDYDNDGDLDILLTGQDSSSPRSTRIYRNNDGSFTDLNAGLTGVNSGSAAWGDYDNDSDLDLLLTGNSDDGRISKIYRNDAGSFTNLNAGLTGVDNSSAAWGDYDNDGNLDILLTGDDGFNLISKIYHNDDSPCSTLTDFSPAANTVAAPLNSRVVFTYSVAMNSSTVTSRTIAVHSMMQGLVTATHRVDGNVVTVTPNRPFFAGEPIYAIAGRHAGDINGVFPAGMQWQFTAGEVTHPCTDGFFDLNAGLPGVYLGDAAWGDYDRDGDLDLLLTGHDGSNLITNIYRNDGGSFTDIYAGLPGVYPGSAAWGDYDNDGDLDILLTGADSDGLLITKIYRNDGSSFTDINAGLTGLAYSRAAWGDYDNDGDLDILLTGDSGNGYLTKIYRNDGGSFSAINAGLPGVYWGSAAWGDADNDGDLDILLAGYDGSNFISKIYRNDSGSFTDLNAGLPGVYLGRAAWGDYDNDGDLDILLTGVGTGGPISKIYRNDSGSFTDLNAGLTGVFWSSAAWGDADNDGDLDILLAGHDGSNSISKIYRNDGGSFIDIGAGLTGVSGSNAAWGDYDNDGDLDILLTGDSGDGYITKIYQSTNHSCSTLTGFSPAANAVAAPLDSPIVLTYSLAMQAGSVTSHTVAIHSMQQGLVTATPRISGNVVTVTPARPFFPGEQVYAVATTRVTDLFGARPLTATHWQFTTGQILSDRCVGDFVDIAAGLTGVQHSSPAWADYDTDGDLDFVLTGQDSGGTPLTQLYRNDGGSFTSIAAGLTGVRYGRAAWGDYDDDGDPDLLLTGQDAGGTSVAKIYRNDDGSFTAIAAGLTGVRYSSAAWGDFDEDGDLDLALTGVGSGGPLSKIYRNDGGSFSDLAAGLTGLGYGNVAWGDTDNDGDLDLLLTGQDLNWDPLTLLYRNDDGSFSAISSGLPGVRYGDAAWGDYDEDGDLDLLLTGQDDSSTPLTRIYRNDSGSFSDLGAGLTGLAYSSAAWGDTDNDGDLDLLLTGQDNNYALLSKLYRNDGGSFSAVTGGLPGVDHGRAVWGDADSDGDVDILLTGNSAAGPIAKIYRNDDCPSDLALSKAVTPTAAQPGAAITYTLTLTNHGLLSFDDALLTDTLSPALTDISYQAAGVTLTPTGSLSYSWQIGPMAPAQVGVITITARLTQPLIAGPLVNEATLFATGDISAANNSRVITLTVLNVGPTLTPLVGQTITETNRLTVTAAANDTNGDVLTFTLVAAPVGANITSGGVFTWTPTEADGPGVYSATIRVSDGLLTASQTIPLTVTEQNETPLLTAIGDKSIAEQTVLTFTAAATDSDIPAQPLRFSLSDAPSGATIGSSSGAFSWTPTEAQGPGIYTFTVVVSDTVITDNEQIVVTVNETNHAPVLSAIGDKAVAEETVLTFTAVATDSDMPTQPLTYSLAGAPSGASIGSSSGAFSWTPTEAQGSGIYTFTVVVSDTVITDSETIRVTVSETNHAPVLTTIGDKAVAENSPTGVLVATVYATDPDTNEVLTYTITAGNSGGAFGLQPSLGLLTVQGALDAETVNAYTLTVQAADKAGAVDTTTVRIRVTDINEAPRFTSTPPESVVTGHPYSYTVTTADPDAGAVLTVTLINGPAWLSFTVTGPGRALLDGTGVAGVYPVELRVTDQGKLTATQQFTLTAGTNHPPVISQGGSVNVTMTEDGAPTPFSLTLSASDAENDPLQWAISLNPAHGAAAVGSGSGSGQTIAYTPTANYNGADGFTVQVHDGQGGSDTILVTVAITAVNDLPVAVDDIAVVVRDGETGPVFVAAANPVTLTVLTNDRDPVEGSPLSISAVGTPDQGGSAVSAGSVINYLPAILTGTETFTYAVSDGTDSVTATVRVTVVQGQGGITIATDETVVIPDTGSQQNFTVTIQIPAGAVTTTDTALVYNSLTTTGGSPPPGFGFAGLDFTLDAFVAGIQQDEFYFRQPITLTLEYSEADVAQLNEAELRLYTWTGSSWSSAGIERISLDRDANRITFRLYHLSEFALMAPATHKVYLPLITYDDTRDKPDLVIDKIIANSSVVVVTIRNAGPVAVTEPFWVDVYIDPTAVPRVNQPWQTLADHGAVWGVTRSLLPGETFSLVSGGSYYDDENSDLSFTAGDTVYALVDSVNFETNYGNIREEDESNNLAGPVLSTAEVESEFPVEPGPTIITAEFPPRMAE